jgi:integrase
MQLTSINAASDVPTPAGTKPVVQRWSEEEAAAVLRQCLVQDDQVARYVRVALGTGLRPEEMLGLAWAAVDIPNQVLEVVQVATEVGGHAELRSGGKTVAAERPVTFDKYTAAALIAQREHVRELRRIRAALDVKRAVKDRDAIEWTDLDLVFPSERGTVWSRAVLRRAFDKLQAASKVEATGKVVTRITLRATRATHASLLADMGANLVAVGQRFGHTRLRHTEPYLRGSESAQRALAEMMGSLLATAARGSSGAEGPDIPATRTAESDSGKVDLPS